MKRSLWLGVLILALVWAGLASAAPDGDVDGDGRLSAADVLVLQRALAGEVTLDAAAQESANVAPLSGGIPAPDMAIDTGDLVVLMRAVAGDPNVLLGGPILDPPSNPNPAVNPFAISGRALAFATVDLYVNGNLRGTATAGSDGRFSVDSVLDDGPNDLTVTATTAGGTTPLSSPVQVTYTNTIDRALPTDFHITADTAWTPGTGEPYMVSGNLTVDAGATLFLVPDTELHFVGGRLVVNGSLQLFDESGPRVVLTSGSVPQTRGSWLGVRLASSGSVIDGAEISYATNGVDIPTGVTATVRNSVISEFSSAGIEIYSTVPGVLIEGNWLDNSTGAQQGVGISIAASDFSDLIGNTILGAVTGISTSAQTLISENTISSCTNGISLTAIDTAVTALVDGNQLTENGTGIVANAAASLITNNLITQNTTGIQVQSTSGADLGPGPTIHQNSIFANQSQDLKLIDGLSSSVPVIVDAENNWWGYADAFQIEGRISDGSDHQVHRNFPSIADYVPFLDQNGVPQGDGEFLVGELDNGTTSSCVTPCVLLGVGYVPPGATYTLPPGVTLEAVDDAELIVGGTLLAGAVAGVQTTLRPTATATSWEGIRILPTSLGAVIENLRFEGAILTGRAAITADAADVTIRGSAITGFESFGVSLMNGAGGLIEENQILGTGTGNGIDVASGASPNLRGNDVSQVEKGIYVHGASSPTIEDNTIHGNSWGIYLFGQEGGADPTPTINGNSLESNPSGNLGLERFDLASVSLLNARDNWWGSDQLASVADTIVSVPGGFLTTDGDPPVPVDYSGFLDAAPPLGVPAAGSSLALTTPVTAISRTPIVFRPAQGESVSIAFQTFDVGDVSVRIYAEDTHGSGGPVLKTLVIPSASAGSHQVVWDGRDEASSLVPDEAYVFEIEVAYAQGSFTYVPGRSPIGPDLEHFVNADTVNAYENDPWVVPFDGTSFLGRISGNLRPNGISDPTGEFPILTRAPMLAGSGTLVWDGRDPSGAFVEGTNINISSPAPEVLKDYAMLVQGGAPEITGVPPEAGAPPRIEVKSDPFVVVQSYNELTRFEYCLDHAATVTIEILDPQGNLVETLVPGEPRPAVACTAAEHLTETWSGIQPGTFNRIVSPEDGVYTFKIEAQSDAAPGAEFKSVYRGAIQVRQ